MGKIVVPDRACSAGCVAATSNPAARAVPRPTNFFKRGASRRQTPISRVSHYCYKGEPVCRPNLPVSDLTCRDIPKSGGFLSTDPTWPLLQTSLFCCPSIFARALRAAIVAAELPLRGKLLAEAIIFSIDQRILEVMKKESNNRQA